MTGSGLDRTLTELQGFVEEVEDFLEVLQTHAQLLDRARSDLVGLWDDAVRRGFDRRYDEVADPLEAFRTHHGPDYVRFLEGQVRALMRYFDA